MRAAAPPKGVRGAKSKGRAILRRQGAGKRAPRQGREKAPQVHQCASAQRAKDQPVGLGSRPLPAGRRNCIKTDTKSARARRGEKRAARGCGGGQATEGRAGRSRRRDQGRSGPPGVCRAIFRARPGRYDPCTGGAARKIITSAVEMD